MGHPTLRQTAAPYPLEMLGSAEFNELVTDMRETMHTAGGIGLAAPQIDVPFQIAVIELDGGPSRYGKIPSQPFGVYINPRITVLDPETAGYWEGCLSVPGIMGFVERPQRIQVNYVNVKGEETELVAEGFLATVFQHEFDHLFGHLFVDRVTDTAQLSFDTEYHAFHEDRD